MSGRYLLRFDDLCPTMRWRTWEEIEEALVGSGVRPLLAVVPDNRDPHLQVEPPNGRFWDRVRGWQARGWTIGVHGYQHTYLTRDPGIVGLNRSSEFAGLPAREQEGRLRRALEIFEGEGIRPEVWVAPAHSFDRTTTAIVRSLGLRVISDGLGLLPHADEHGTVWIPQQLWRFRRLPLGVWTVCCHHNAWGPSDVAGFRRALEAYRDRLVDVGTVVERYAARRRSAADRLAGPALLAAIRGKRALRRLAGPWDGRRRRGSGRAAAGAPRGG